MYTGMNIFKSANNRRRERFCIFGLNSVCLLNISVESPKDSFAVLYFQRFLLAPVLMLKVITLGIMTDFLT